MNRPSNILLMVLRRGNVGKLKKLPPGSRSGDNKDAVKNGFRPGKQKKGFSRL
jgi:hypothetical protein